MSHTGYHTTHENAGHTKSPTYIHQKLQRCSPNQLIEYTDSYTPPSDVVRKYKHLWLKASLVGPPLIFQTGERLRLPNVYMTTYTCTHVHTYVYTHTHTRVTSCLSLPRTVWLWHSKPHVLGKLSDLGKPRRLVTPTHTSLETPP